MTTKENPGLGAGANEGTLREFKTQAIGLAVLPPLQACPGLTSQRFPGKRQALLRACDRAASLRAVADFVHAGMFVRHVAGNYCELTRDAIAHEAWTYARLSPAGKEVRPIDVAVITARMDEFVREKYVV